MESDDEWVEDISVDNVSINGSMKPMKIKSNPMSRTSKVCYVLASFSAILALLVVSYVSFSSYRDSDKESTGLSEPKNEINDRELICFNANDITGGKTGGHCETVFVSFSNQLLFRGYIITCAEM